jgi:hypothetical protein
MWRALTECYSLYIKYSLYKLCRQPKGVAELRWTDAYLDSLRREGDPEADELITSLSQKGETGAVNAILRTLLQNDQAIPSELPDEVAAYLHRTGRLPSWADRARIERASRFFMAHGLAIAAILGTASLVECYACQKGVKVLTFSYRMAQDPYRRIGETTQWLLLVMAPGGLFEGGEGIPAIQKVRLMHAAIRYLIRRTGRWDEAAWGVPICQEDLLGTLLAFSFIVIRGLRRLGVKVSRQEAEDYLYFYRLVGRMLGIRPEAIPTNEPEAAAATRAIYGRHQGPSPEGVQMTHALLEMYAHLTPSALDGLVPALLRYLIGDRVADWMAVPHSPWRPALEQSGCLGSLVDRLLRRHPPLRKAVERFGYHLLTRQAIAMAGYERASFTIPTALRKAWGMTS